MAPRAGARSGSAEHAPPEQVKGRAPVRAPLYQREAVHVPFDLPPAPPEAGRREHRVEVAAHAVGEPAQRAALGGREPRPQRVRGALAQQPRELQCERAALGDGGRPGAQFGDEGAVRLGQLGVGTPHEPRELAR